MFAVLRPEAVWGQIWDNGLQKDHNKLVLDKTLELPLKKKMQ